MSRRKSTRLAFKQKKKNKETRRRRRVRARRVYVNKATWRTDYPDDFGFPDVTVYGAIDLDVFQTISESERFKAIVDLGVTTNSAHERVTSKSIKLRSDLKGKNLMWVVFKRFDKKPDGYKSATSAAAFEHYVVDHKDEFGIDTTRYKPGGTVFFEEQKTAAQKLAKDADFQVIIRGALNETLDDPYNFEVTGEKKYCCPGDGTNACPENKQPETLMGLRSHYDTVCRPDKIYFQCPRRENCKSADRVTPQGYVTCNPDHFNNHVLRCGFNFHGEDTDTDGESVSSGGSTESSDSE